VTSIADSSPRRKSAPERRSELVSAASAIGLAEGLESLTLRRVADALGVFPGLVNHYFPAVDDLVAAAFGEAAGNELDEIFARVDEVAEPLARMRRLIELLLSEERDAISLLWLDAWHSGRRRPALRDEVSRQMLAWQTKVGQLIQHGVDDRIFRTDGVEVAAVRILAVIDGLSVQAVMRSAIGSSMVSEMVISTAERGLGLEPGGLNLSPRPANRA
jgi:AcrR family transcriptional regulator